MTRPVIGIIGSAQLDSPVAAQRVGDRYLEAVTATSEALPIIFAGCPELTDVATLVDLLDGVLLTGARANVHPSHYGAEPTPAYEPYDERRDALALPLIRACVERGLPVLGICRGLQEMNVAFGGTLHPEIRDLPGRQNHRMPRLPNGEPHPDLALVFADRHDVRLIADGAFARLYGRDLIRVNSLHGQGILDPADRIVIEGVADDGTIEAIRVADAPGFALGVQWHAEHEPQTNLVNRTLLRAFAEAAADYHRGRHRRGVAAVTPPAAAPPSAAE